MGRRMISRTCRTCRASRQGGIDSCVIASAWNKHIASGNSSTNKAQIGVIICVMPNEGFEFLELSATFVAHVRFSNFSVVQNSVEHIMVSKSTVAIRTS